MVPTHNIGPRHQLGGPIALRSPTPQAPPEQLGGPSSSWLVQNNSGGSRKHTCPPPKNPRARVSEVGVPKRSTTVQVTGFFFCAPWGEFCRQCPKTHGAKTIFFVPVCANIVRENNSGGSKELGKLICTRYLPHSRRETTRGAPKHVIEKQLGGPSHLYACMHACKYVVCKHAPALKCQHSTGKNLKGAI